MAPKWEIIYQERVVKHDIPDIDHLWREKIKKVIESKLAVDPEIYGKPLHFPLAHYRSLRVGDYRIIYRASNGKVIIFLIASRSRTYKEATKRLF